MGRSTETGAAIMAGLSSMLQSYLTTTEKRRAQKVEEERLQKALELQGEKFEFDKTQHEDKKSKDSIDLYMQQQRYEQQAQQHADLQDYRRQRLASDEAKRTAGIKSLFQEAAGNIGLRNKDDVYGALQEYLPQADSAQSALGLLGPRIEQAAAKMQEINAKRREAGGGMGDILALMSGKMDENKFKERELSSSALRDEYTGAERQHKLFKSLQAFLHEAARLEGKGHPGEGLGWKKQAPAQPASQPMGQAWGNLDPMALMAQAQAGQQGMQQPIGPSGPGGKPQPITSARVPQHPAAQAMQHASAVQGWPQDENELNGDRNANFALVYWWSIAMNPNSPIEMQMRAHSELNKIAPVPLPLFVKHAGTGVGAPLKAPLPGGSMDQMQGPPAPSSRPTSTPSSKKQ